MQKMGEVHIFTASTRAYADPIIDEIDPNGYITGRYYREVRSNKFIRYSTANMMQRRIHMLKTWILLLKTLRNLLLLMILNRSTRCIRVR